MAIGSKEKHFRGHLEFARKCREYGCAAVRCTHRVLDCRSFSGFHLEICRTERLRLDEAMARTCAHAGDLLPVLAHRSNGQPWRITMDLPVFCMLYTAFTQTGRPDPASPASAPCHGSDPVPDRPPAESSAP